MESLTTVLLKPGEGDRIVAGHPWIYHGEILRLTAPVVDGALVQVKDHRQRLLGVGFYNSRSKINVRILAPERVEVTVEIDSQRNRVRATAAGATALVDAVAGDAIDESERRAAAARSLRCDPGELPVRAQHGRRGDRPGAHEARRPDVRRRAGRR